MGWSLRCTRDDKTDIDILSDPAGDDEIAWYENEQVDRTTSSTSP